MTFRFAPLAALVVMLYGVYGGAALAQEKEGADTDRTVSQSSTSVLKQPPAEAPKNLPAPVKKWIDAENALLDTLSDKDKESFFILRNKYSIIRVIDIVKRDVGSAVKSCGEKNPSMKNKMDTRFSEWKTSVDPIVGTAQKTFDRELSSQTYVDVKQARTILKLNDEAYEYGDKAVKKVPLTTPDACQSLLDSMDRTEDEMVDLLQKTLLPESVIKKREAQAGEKSQAPSGKIE